MKFWVTLAALCAAGAASAQDVMYSDAATKSCLSEIDADGDRRSCIGRSAQICMGATNDGSTTIGMMDCLGAEQEFWDGRLNAGYKVVRSKARALDAEMAEIGSSAPKVELPLRDMQRAWITYRDTTCDFEQSLWGGGSGGGPAVISCLMQMTGEQALYLENAWFGE